MWLLLGLLPLVAAVQGECSRPERIEHAVLRSGELQDSYPVGTTLTYRCIPGYQLIRGTAPRITCSDASQWLPETPKFCEGQICKSPDIENGRVVNMTDMRLGDEITFACNDGYRLIGEKTARCTLKSGSVDWNYTPTCQLIPCFPPPPTNHGSFTGDVGQEYASGSAVTYSCDKGYSLIGNKTLVCRVAADGENGEWDSPPPECKVIPCFPPPPTNHGSVSGDVREDYASGSAVTYSCDKGYSLIGKKTLVCRVAADGENGEWDSPPPECKVVQCPRPEIVHGSINAFLPSYAYEHSLIITCDAGYRLSGENFIKCGADNEWHPPVPKCDLVPEPTGSATVIAPTTVLSGDGTVPGSTEPPTDKPASTKAPKDKPATTKSPKDEPGSSSNLGTVLGKWTLVLALLMLTF